MKVDDKHITEQLICEWLSSLGRTRATSVKLADVRRLLDRIVSVFRDDSIVMRAQIEHLEEQIAALTNLNRQQAEEIAWQFRANKGGDMSDTERRCPHCSGSLERYEDPKAVELIAALTAANEMFMNDKAELRAENERLKATIQKVIDG
uniref:Uncharacterized protein n=1 Tax=viral metagenome TaxID=1070528 RepID=A0A6M3KRJ0_9ZZZZ